MLRYILVKLPSIASKTERAVSPTQTVRGLRSISPVSRSQCIDIKRDEDEAALIYNGSAPYLSTFSNDPSNGLLLKPVLEQKQSYSKRGRQIEDDEEEEETVGKWREDVKSSKSEKHERNATVEDDQPVKHMSTIQQYELEAARPRMKEKHDVYNVRAMFERENKAYALSYLQPNKQRPYGSQENMYFPAVFKIPGLASRTKGIQKIKSQEKVPSQKTSDTKSTDFGISRREFSTISRRSLNRPKSNLSSLSADQELDTDTVNNDLKSYSKALKYQNPKKHVHYDLLAHKQYFIQPSNPIKVSPPDFKCPMDKYLTEPTSYTPTRKRSEEKVPIPCMSYSEKLKLNQVDRFKTTEPISRATLSDSNSPTSQVVSDRAPSTEGSLRNIHKQGEEKKLLQTSKTLVSRRSLRIHRKSHDNVDLRSPSINPMREMSTIDLTSRKSYTATIFRKKLPINVSISITNNRSKHEKCKPVCKLKTKSIKEYMESQDPPLKDEELTCPPKKHKTSLMKKYQESRPFEPRPCADKPEKNTVIVKSKVRLKPPRCVPPPDYFCKPKENKCPPRADQCLKVPKKKLPVIEPQPCPCREDPQPTRNPKMKRLQFKSSDPPRECPCGTCCNPVRADDNMKPKRKSLAPFVPGECECVEPPPLVDVPLKRLPKHCPEDVCWPVRVCPVKPPCVCPPEACDYKMKKLPKLEAKSCPCVEHHPTLLPKLKRLDLKVPEPPRNCPVEKCHCSTRADGCGDPKRKKLPKFTPGDCPCIERPLVDFPLRPPKCRHEEIECFPLPNTCDVFPRADWGCWEYLDEEYKEIDVKCLPKKKEPCEMDGHKQEKKIDVCGKLGLSPDINQSRRKFTTMSSMDLFNKLKGGISKVEKPVEKASENVDAKIVEKSNMVSKETSPVKNKLPKKRSRSCPPIDLIQKLSTMNRHMDKEILFKPPRRNTLSIESILEKMPSTSSSKPIVNQVAVRNISTCEIRCKMEKTGKKSKGEDCKKKKKCVEFKLDNCPPRTYNSNKRARIPVCCKKCDTPYASFSETTDTSTKPFLQRTQWNTEKKERDVNDIDKRKYSTVALIESLPKNKEYTTKEDTGSEGSCTNTYRSMGMEIFQQQQSQFSDRIVQDVKEKRNMAYKPVDKRFSQILRQKSLYSNIPSSVSANQIPTFISDFIKRHNRQEPGGILSRHLMYNATKEEEEITKALSESSLSPHHFTARYFDTKRSTYQRESKDCSRYNPPESRVESWRKRENGHKHNTVVEDLWKRKSQQQEHCKTDAAENLKKDNSWWRPSLVQKISGTFNSVFTKRQKPRKPLRSFDPNEALMRQYHILCKGVTSDGSALEEVDIKLKQITEKISNLHESFKKRNMMNSRVVRCCCSMSVNLKSEHSFSKCNTRGYCSTSKHVVENQPCEFLFHRSLATNMTLARRDSDQNFRPTKNKKCPNFKLKNCPERHHRKTCQRSAKELNCVKQTPPYPSFSECNTDETLDKLSECPYQRDKIQGLQPRYPFTAEFKATVPPQPQLDLALEAEYVRLKSGKTNEGVTQDCSSFGDDVHVPRCKDMEKPVDSDCLAIEKQKNRRKLKTEFKQPGGKNKPNCGSNNMMNRKQISELSSKTLRCKKPDRIPEDDCKPEPCPQDEDLCDEKTMMQKIVDYFKARPDCPGPEECKMRLKKEKAEKAAEAAGMILVDPKKMPPELVRKILASKCKEDVEEDECEDGNTNHRQSWSRQEKPGQFPKRFFSSLVQTRQYSNIFNTRNLDEINRLLEEVDEQRHEGRDGEKSKLEGRFSFMESTNEEEDSKSFDGDVKNDNSCLNKRVGLERFTKDFQSDSIPSRENILQNVLHTDFDSLSTFSKRKFLSCFRELSDRFERVQDLTHEELEKIKTQNVVRELETFLSKGDDPDEKS